MIAPLLLTVLLPVALCAGDLAAIKAEPNFERRSELALANADTALDNARKAYSADDGKVLVAALTESGESVELCRAALDESGANPRKRPKYFKKAEIGIRRLIRRLETFRDEMSVEDRAPVEALLDKAHAAHDHILGRIMGKK